MCVCVCLHIFLKTGSGERSVTVTCKSASDGASRQTILTLIGSSSSHALSGAYIIYIYICMYYMCMSMYRYNCSLRRAAESGPSRSPGNRRLAVRRGRQF